METVMQTYSPRESDWNIPREGLFLRQIYPFIAPITEAMRVQNQWYPQHHAAHHAAHHAPHHGIMCSGDESLGRINNLERITEGTALRFDDGITITEEKDELYTIRDKKRKIVYVMNKPTKTAIEERITNPFKNLGRDLMEIIKLLYVVEVLEFAHA